jgi:hypothetical protein
MVPPSIVVNTKISKPDAVKVGAVPPAQSTDPGQVIAPCDCPFVSNKVKLQLLAEAVGLEKTNVCVPVETVALTTFPLARSIVSEPPPVSPSAL